MLESYVPKLEDLRFRETFMSDEETMSYNHAWGGTIPFPKVLWLTMSPASSFSSGAAVFAGPAATGAVFFPPPRDAPALRAP